MNWLSRFELLIGKENLEKIKNQTILIIGLGGVGSYTIESLVRSGINNLIIVDKDTIDITNLNRQLMTDIENVGLKKVDVIESRMKKINPNINIIKYDLYVDLDNINKLFENSIDYVIDSCDDLKVKKELVRICSKKNIKLISSMGTGNKMDPSKLEIIDIRKTSVDPLARNIRKMIKDEKIKKKIPVVCSTEQPIKNDSNIIGSNSFVPSTAGLLIASYVIRDIIGDLNENNK